jgi:hypothetical protein
MHSVALKQLGPVQVPSSTAEILMSSAVQLRALEPVTLPVSFPMKILCMQRPSAAVTVGPLSAAAMSALPKTPPSISAASIETSHEPLIALVAESALDPREVEQIADDPAEPSGLAPHDAEP